MATRRPGGIRLPLGNKGNGRAIAMRRARRRPIFFPGAGQRIPQRESSGGSPPGTLPTPFGRKGLTPFLSGRSSIKRSFQTLSAPRPSPFFAGFTPTGLERPQAEGFPLEEVQAAPVAEIKKARLMAAKERRRVKLTGPGAVTFARNLFARAAANTGGP